MFAPPPLHYYWFHSVDKPLSDPIQQRREQQTCPQSPTSPKANPDDLTKTNNAPQKWVRFSSRDNDLLELAFQSGTSKKVLVNEDQLFEVDVEKRTICAAYWESAVYKVRRATWFTRGTEGSQWMPCDEEFAKQIEEGYCEHKPWKTEAPIVPVTSLGDSPIHMPGFDGLDTPLTLEDAASSPMEMKWKLKEPHGDDYIVYTSADTAWLLSDTTTSRITKSIFMTLTNNQNLGGTRLIRGYPEVQQGESVGATSKSRQQSISEQNEDKEATGPAMSDGEIKESERRKQEMEDYENEKSESTREIDHLIICIHGIGQKMTERLGLSFIHDVNVLRRTMKGIFATSIAMTANPKRKNGIQVLPILWRHQIRFGLANEDEAEKDDMNKPDVEEGQPTLEELTIEGVQSIRNIVSDALLDIPLYMTKYRDQMLSIISNEINRVYRLFLRNNPDFLARGGKVSLMGHSLGSALAFDLLTLQPFDEVEQARVVDRENNNNRSYISSQYKPNDSFDERIPPFHFNVQNLFCVGSPVGLFLLIKGSKVASRKLLAQDQLQLESPSANPVCYPDCENIYNIFFRSDPVAYRLEPLIARHYTASLKPEPIPYHKGGLKGIFDAGFTVGSDIASKAEAVIISLRTSATSWFRREELPAGGQANKDDDPEEISMANLVSPTTSSEPSSPSSAPVDGFRMLGTKGSATKGSDRSTKSNMRAYATGAERLKMLNSTGRVDYFIQEGILESSYLSALQSHLSYWNDTDVAAFLIRSIYK